VVKTEKSLSRRFFANSLSSAPCFFCRINSLGLIGLMTCRSVMGSCCRKLLLHLSDDVIRALSFCVATSAVNLDFYLKQVKIFQLLNPITVFQKPASHHPTDFFVGCRW
jgi:hypothetical protein